MPLQEPGQPAVIDNGAANGCQSSGAVRIFLNGEVVLHIEPLARPMIWGDFHMETQDADASPGPVSAAGMPSDD